MDTHHPTHPTGLARRPPQGRFVGLSTLDVIQLVDRLPHPDEKVKTLDLCVAADGPAANASVAFASLGGQPTLITRVSFDASGQMITDDLEKHGVRVLNVSSEETPRSTIASILVTRKTGERAVVSAADHGRSHTHVETSTSPLPFENCDANIVVMNSYELDLCPRRRIR